ncbi:MAG: hypothetical protein HKN04_04960 [Rhodothermaceae bacterium]|nr:hypothetical protein [Rhodothermaceae bacterium]
MHRAVFSVVLLLAAPAFAQEEPQPDTTDWHSYYPLAVGNEWQFVRIFLGPEPIPVETIVYQSEEVVGDSLMEGEHYAVVQFCSQSEEDPIICGETVSLIRYDEGFTTVLQRREGSGGEPVFLPWSGFPCSLNLPFSVPDWTSAACLDGWHEEWLVSGDYGVEYCISGDCVMGTHKRFDNLTGGIYFVSGLGPVISGYKGHGNRTLVYARIDGVEYGTRIITVANEPEASPEHAEACAKPRGRAVLPLSSPSCREQRHRERV